VAVARSDATVTTLVRFADGEQSLAQLAAQTGLAVSELEATVRGLVELGALRFATGS
jgi:DNA-binding IclR family transcriptional regulator